MSKIIDNHKRWDEVKALFEELDGFGVTVGIHEGAGSVSSASKEVLTSSEKKKLAYASKRAGTNKYGTDRMRASTIAAVAAINAKIAKAGGTKTAGKEISLATLGSYHEFGKGVPARPFLAPLIDSGRVEVVKVQRKLFSMILDKKISVENALGVLGEWAVRDVQKRIRANIAPPLAEETLKEKSRLGYSSTPLIRTGQLLRSIAYKVVSTRKVDK